ncbi:MULTISPECIES: DUF4365 domain-containing protein [Streptomyces]|uniref:DUF4365 domain-containing protein n=1 Tax=Streptomyces edwardsiae TaxID=3075527 RepID=A0ABU2PPQ8_9ACTN|nr:MULTISPECIES: DUF4365 domain-containing protein [unclassified Streptomyces]MCX2922134.1 DUF4365 domain-containing protein [Streptomyces sp. NEAU-W12]MDT0394134.1 DUF4365 domain-containing protein [Streptomyces sp. DSM 41636]
MTDGSTGGIPHQPSSGPPSAQPWSGGYGVPLTGAGHAPEWVEWAPDFGDNRHRGAFGEEFIRMLATAADLDVTSKLRDRVGVDWQLGYSGRRGTRRYPAIEAQVKCTSSPDVREDHIRFPLKVKNYNQLAGADYEMPRFLFLVLAPADPFTWSHATEDRLHLSHAAYWLCLHDQEPLPLDNRSAQGTRTVYVPRANLLTVDSLHDLFAEDYRDLVAL